MLLLHLIIPKHMVYYLKLRLHEKLKTLDIFNSLLVEEDADLSLEYVIHPLVGVHALIKFVCLVIVHCPVAHVLKEKSD